MARKVKIPSKFTTTGTMACLVSTGGEIDDNSIAKSLGLPSISDAGSSYQTVGVFRKRIGKKTVVFQGRGHPDLSICPPWSNVQKF